MLDWAYRTEWVDENFDTVKIFRRADWHNNDIQNHLESCIC